jgi:hypothetical protein
MKNQAYNSEKVHLERLIPFWQKILAVLWIFLQKQGFTNEHLFKVVQNVEKLRTRKKIVEKR